MILVGLDTPAGGVPGGPTGLVAARGGTGGGDSGGGGAGLGPWGPAVAGADTLAWVGVTPEDSLEELGELADTAGLRVAGKIIQKRPHPDPATYIGEGKAREVATLVEGTGASGIIVDDELSGTQLRNLEEALKVDVVDRTQLILDIFARRAQTREGKLQVELAQLNYRLPRLAGRGTELSRLGGGIGTRGPGETKLETDRRAIRRRIADLKRETEGVRQQRGLHRTSRRSVPVPVVALAGYTNAGKSTLFRALTGADVLVENKLFATLDPTTRKVDLPGGREVLLTDTVGFIRKLPHHLVAAFRATLEEVLEADLILVVTDLAQRLWREQLEATRRVLGDIGASDRPVLHVLNKIDLVEEDMIRAMCDNPPADMGRPVAVSALTGRGIDELKERVGQALAAGYEVLRVTVPFERSDLVSLAHEHGKVQEKEYGPQGVRLKVVLPGVWASRIRAALGGGPRTAARPDGDPTGEAPR